MLTQALFSQQEKVKTVNSAMMIGLGHISLMDTYLSPLEYSGTNISIFNERFSNTGLINDKLLLRQQFYIKTAFTKNPASTSSEYYGDISYNVLGLYPVFKNNKFKLLGGGGIDALLGGIYNVRNSNNPGSLKTSLNIELAAMAMYSWRNLTFRWQMSMPIVGMFFTPAYGQSYYEIFSLGNDKGTVHLSSFNNYVAFKNYITVDIPINNITVRTGYAGNYYKTDVNNLYTKIDSHQFVLGFVVESLNFGGRKVKNSQLIESVYY